MYERNFKGALDDIRIYNRALSDSEVIALYNQERPHALAAPSLRSPANGAFLAAPGVQYVWSKIDSATTCRLQAARDTGFSQMAWDSTIAAADTACTRSMPDGRYWWRARAQSASDTSGWSASRRFTVDTHPPLKPSSLTANGATPSPWTNANTFTIAATVSDSGPAGIRRYLLKIGSAPNYSYDTTRTFAVVPYNVLTDQHGKRYAYVWAEDSAGNASHLNRDSVSLRYDTIPPYGAKASSPLRSNTLQFTVSWAANPGSDALSGLNGRYRLDYRRGRVGWLVLQNNYPGTSYQYTATQHDTLFFEAAAYDSAGNVERLVGAPECSTLVDTSSDATQPRLRVNLDTLRVIAGNGFVLRVVAADDCSLKTVQVDLAREGAAGPPFSTRYFAREHDSTWYATVDTVYASGVPLAITACDTAGNFTRYPKDPGFHLLPVLEDYAWTAFPANAWRMISFPYDPSRAAYDMRDLAGDALGDYDNTKWRMFRYDPALGYLELAQPHTGPISLGSAFWLKQILHSPQNIGLDSVWTYSRGSTDSLAKIAMASSGWHDFGVPFLYGIGWDDIKAATGADTASCATHYPYTYDGSGWQFPVAVLQPWEGYSIRTTAPLGLAVPPHRAGAKSGDAALWPEGWVATVSLMSENGRDRCNYFGVGKGASPGADGWDYPEPPAFFSGAAGYFTIPGSGERFGADLRPELGGGQAWDFTVEGAGSQASLAVTLPDNFPSGCKCVLADLYSLQTVDVIGGATYSYQAGPREKSRAFRLIAGDDGYVRDELKRSLAAPEATLLLMNQPNPFNQLTRISYQLSRPGKVSLRVYNIAGQLVRVLLDGAQSPGRYSASWDGRDDAGRRAGNGVYFCRLVTGEYTGARRVVMVK